jgi:hypothetical protein
MTGNSFQLAPEDLVIELKAEIKLWLTSNTMWASSEGIALSAILEWRLQEAGYSLWGYTK